MSAVSLLVYIMTIIIQAFEVKHLVQQCLRPCNSVFFAIKYEPGFQEYDEDRYITTWKGIKLNFASQTISDPVYLVH